jgi:hypothetical protein
MNILDVKKVLIKHINNLIGDWFKDKPLYEGLALTIVQANINKFDGLLTMLTDDNGDIMIDELTTNLGSLLEKGYEIDLTTISALLPHRVLIISKEDIQAVIDEIKRG